jgi:hypothetical protein
MLGGRNPAQGETLMTSKNAFVPVVQGLVDAVTFSVAIFALAFAGSGKAASPFESLDKNADGRVSRSEASYDRPLSENFAYCDIDGDGFLSRAEYSDALSNMTASRSSATAVGR